MSGMVKLANSIRSSTEVHLAKVAGDLAAEDIDLDGDPGLPDEVFEPADGEGPLEPDEVPDVVVLAERRCRTKTCLRLFRPVHVAQHYCPRCRGLRVDDTPTAGQSTSWWANTTSRADFQQRAAQEQDRMGSSKTKLSIPLKILN